MLGLLIGSARAWGNEGHEMVGMIAYEFLTPTALNQVHELIGDKTAFVQGTTWADMVKKTVYKWSYNLHFVDPLTRPPTSCGYDDDRDCKDGKCIVGALTNFTRQASCSSQLPALQRGEAIKYLEHFTGDMTQPLHVCGRGDGGTKNSTANFAGKSTQLHFIWDYDMIQKRVLDFHNSTSEYAAYLVQHIKQGQYLKSLDSWVSSHSIQEKNHNGNALFAIDWAVDSDKIDCEQVWPAYDQNPSADLSLEYYQNAVPLIELQLAKGGYRLARLLNEVLQGCDATPTTATSGTATAVSSATATLVTATATAVTGTAPSKTYGVPSKTPSYDGPILNGGVQALPLLGWLAFYLY